MYNDNNILYNDSNILVKLKNNTSDQHCGEWSV